MAQSLVQSIDFAVEISQKILKTIMGQFRNYNCKLCERFVNHLAFYRYLVYRQDVKTGLFSFEFS